MQRLLLCAALGFLVTGCTVRSASHEPNPPRHVANYQDGAATPRASVDQCQLPVAQRTGGWFCY